MHNKSLSLSAYRIWSEYIRLYIFIKWLSFHNIHDKIFVIMLNFCNFAS